MFVNPVPLFYPVHGVSKDHPVADDFPALFNIAQGNLVGLGDVLVGNDPIHYFRPCFDVLHGNGNIILVFDFYVQWLAHGVSSCCYLESG